MDKMRCQTWKWFYNFLFFRKKKIADKVLPQRVGFQAKFEKRTSLLSKYWELGWKIDVFLSSQITPVFLDYSLVYSG